MSAQFSLRPGALVLAVGTKASKPDVGVVVGPSPGKKLRSGGDGNVAVFWSGADGDRSGLIDAAAASFCDSIIGRVLSP